METIFNATFVQWVGCLVGLAGAFLLATKSKVSGFGFVLFLVSNMFWIAFGLMTDAPGLVVMQIGFSLTSILGVWKWLVEPYRASMNQRTLPQGMYYVKGKPAMRRSAWKRA